MGERKSRAELQQAVTDQIVNAIEEGLAKGSWQMPWNGFGAPKNIVTGKGYRGINTLVLKIAQAKNSYEHQLWGSFKQWKEKGGTVKRGESGTMIVFYKPMMFKEKNATTGEELVRKVPFLSYSYIFNFAQVEGVELPEEVKHDFISSTDVDRFVEGTGAHINWNNDRAAYSSTMDHIFMPSKEQFVKTKNGTPEENFYGTLLHELVHWTGHSSRLGRQLGNKFGSEDYAYEELIAELGASFLCAEFGIEYETRESHAQYIQSWLKALKNDKSYIFKASSQSSKAVDFLHGVGFEDEETLDEEERKAA